MGKVKDLTGQRFGLLVVVERAEDRIYSNGQHKIYWLCQCDCGNRKIIHSGSLKSGATTSCGCIKTQRFRHPPKDLTNCKFGKLTAIKRVEDHIQKCGKRKTQWLCKCNCGNECIVLTSELLKGNIKSCGCMKSKGEYIIKEYFDKNNIDYEAQKTFDDLRGIKNGLLSYDFYLPNTKVLVEYQGEQHIRSVQRFGGEEKFQKQKEHDKRKREYAEKNGYRLLEIWYYDLDRIEEILDKELEVG